MPRLVTRHDHHALMWPVLLVLREMGGRGSVEAIDQAVIDLRGLGGEARAVVEDRLSRARHYLRVISMVSCDAVFDEPGVWTTIPFQDAWTEEGLRDVVAPPPPARYGTPGWKPANQCYGFTEVDPDPERDAEVAAWVEARWMYCLPVEPACRCEVCGSTDTLMVAYGPGSRGNIRAARDGHAMLVGGCVNLRSLWCRRCGYEMPGLAQRYHDWAWPKIQPLNA